MRNSGGYVQKPRLAPTIGLMFVLCAFVTIPQALAGTKALVDKSVFSANGKRATVPLPQAAIEARGARVVEDYETMAVVDLGPATARGLSRALGLSVSPLPNHDKILLRHYTLDSSGALPAGVTSPASPPAVPNLYIVVLRSIPKTEWVETIEATGARVVSYVPENSYLVYASHDALQGLLGNGGPVLNVLPFVPDFKVLNRNHFIKRSGFAPTLVQVLKHPSSQDVIDLIQSEALPGTTGSFDLDQTTAFMGELPDEAIDALALQPDVVLIEPAPILAPSGERQSLIVAGKVTWSSGVCMPNPGEGYYEWLRTNGLADLSAVHLGVLDSGLDLGSTSDIHPDFKDSSGLSRVDFNGSYSSTVQGNDCLGHGTIVASIMAAAGGKSQYNTQFQETNSDGRTFWSDAGIAPTAHIHSWKIYNDDYVWPRWVCDPLPCVWDLKDWAFIPDRMYYGLVGLASQGVKIVNISSNGPTLNGDPQTGYTTLSEMLDSKVRDASGIGLGLPLTITVSAGNDYGYAVETPATAKNIITVGASENYNQDNSARANEFCSRAPSSTANNADEIWFSSCSGSQTDTADLNGGYYDLRVKPDLVAPGTRVMGASSRSMSSSTPCWSSAGCPEQLYESAPFDIAGGVNGTSYAAPAVAAAAGLVGQWYSTNHLGRWPSPAMEKAVLINSAYDIGTAATGHIPSHTQGWGRVSMIRAFPQSGYYDLDQTQSFSSSGSGPWARQFSVPAEQAGEPVYVTLVWTDAPGFGAAGFALKNDLDLRVDVSSPDAHFAGNSFDNATGYSIRYFTGDPITYDRRNNVEEVVFVPATYGIQTFQITVTPSAIVQGPQDFALLVTNAD